MEHFTVLLGDSFKLMDNRHGYNTGSVCCSNATTLPLCFTYIYHIK